MLRTYRRHLATRALAWTNRAPLLALALALLPSCGRDRLDVPDLTAAEREFVTRFVVLERAHAVALADPAVGTALLDSLSRAWGDSANAIARRQVPAEPERAAAVYELLGRILAAEGDSLVRAPVARRLRAPLPQGARLDSAAPGPVDEER
jgi:hypothetical protein